MNVLNIVKNNRVIPSFVLATGFLAALFIFWFVAATKYQTEIDHWIEVGRAQGYKITYDRREQFGFPRRAVLRFVNLHWINSDGIEFHADDLDISAALGQTKNFIAKFKGKVEIVTPVDTQHYTLVLGGESGQAQVSLADDGTWEECSLAMQAAHLGRSPDYIFLTDELKLSAKRPAAQPTDIKSAGLTLSGEARTVTLPAAMPESFGSKMAYLQTDLRVMGAVPDFRKKESVAIWNKNFGVAEFDRLDIEWGNLLLTSKGTMGFDDDLQPEGAFAAVVGHQDRLLETLKKGGYIAPASQEMLTSAMKLFAKPAPIKGQTGIEIPVAVQLGGFFLGPVKIFAFPQIGWE